MTPASAATNQAPTHTSSLQPAARILRRAEVERLTGLSCSAIYAMMAKGQFPASFPISARAVGWLESSITAWINERAGIAAQQ